MMMFFSFLLTFSLMALSLDANVQKGTSRIIGGRPAHIYQYPFVAAINIQSSDMTWFCGGSLYGSQWIVTAGQCVNGATLFTIRLGAVSLNDPDDNRLIISTSTYFLHEEYNAETLENDIGLIKLRMPVTHTDYVKSFNYLAIDELWSNSHVYALGWGQTSDHDSTFSNELLFAYVTTLTNEECKITYGNQIKDSMVCVAGNFNEGACHGDTGSPLVLLHPREFTELVGVSSFVSANGCETTDPSGYTRIYSYKDWIQNVIDNNSE